MTTTKKKKTARKSRKLGAAATGRPKRGTARPASLKRSNTKGASDTTVARAFEKAVQAGDLSSSRKFLQHMARRSGWSVYDPRWGLSAQTLTAYTGLSNRTKAAKRK
jgi:hypothetical protein